MSETAPLRVGQTLIGPLFNEPMWVETVSAAGNSSWVVGLVGAQSERFRRITMSESDLAAVSILDAEMAFNGDGNLLRLGIQAYTLGIAYDFDPYFGLSISRVDPLPHQLEAVYDYLLELARVRFLLADDAGAGKTIMAGLLIKELKLRGMCERILIVAPANLAFQWQRELKEKFDEKFFVIKGDDIRDQFGVNQWLEQKQLITSLDLAKRTEILPGLRQVQWDLIVVDEAHRMSWSPPARKTARYALGELLRDISDHMLLLTATPHKGAPANFRLSLQLLDVDAYADVTSIREAMDRRRAPFYLRRTKEAMVCFPERQPDNTWVAKKIFTSVRKEAARLWSWLVERHATIRQLGGRWPHMADLRKEVKGLFPGLHSQLVQMILDDFCEAVASAESLRKKGEPFEYPHCKTQYRQVLFSNQAPCFRDGRMILPCGTAGKLSVRIPKGVMLPGRLMEVRLSYGEVEIVCEVQDEVRPVGPTIGIDLGVNTVIAATDGEKAIVISGREIKATIQRRNKRLGDSVSKQAKRTKGSRRHKRLQRDKYRVLSHAKNKVRDLCHKATRKVADAFPNAKAYVGEPFNDACRKMGRKQAQTVASACNR